MPVVRWFRSHPTVRVLLLVVLVAGPGYARQEQQVRHLGHVAAQSQDAADRAKQALEVQKAQTALARKITCDAQNDTYGRFNDLLFKLTLPASHPPTDEDRAKAETTLAPYLFPLRDCTPQGIADFYRHGPTGDRVIITPDTQTTTTLPVAVGTRVPRVTARTSATTRPTSTTGTTTTATRPTSTTAKPCGLPPLTIPRSLPCPL